MQRLERYKALHAFFEYVERATATVKDAAADDHVLPQGATMNAVAEREQACVCIKT